MLFAIGDIHGQLEPLKELLAKCLVSASHQKQEPKFLFIGDYIDRGPDSKGVVDYLILLSKSYDCIFLRGNHEDMLMNDPELMWGNGGVETLKSYGWSPAFRPINTARELKDLILDVIPQEHMLWFGATKLHHFDGKRTFVHAGIYRHLGGIENQSERVKLWVRNEFLDDPSMRGGYVVHGHTPTVFENGDKLPIEKPNRVNIDTGAAYGGRLTAAIFLDAQVEVFGFIQVDVVKEGPYE
jgi:serine/threonine protein phosphatase 1